MALSLSVGTLDAHELGPFEFQSGKALVSELRTCVQQAQPRHIFKLLLEGRVLEDEETLVGTDVQVQVVFEIDYMERGKDVECFEDLPLNENVLRSIYEYGFQKPSAMQKISIPPVVDGRNLIMQSSSGTGKTASYVASSAHLVDAAIATTQVLVLAPTRELACPIQKVALAIGQYSRMTSATVIGGVDMSQQILDLKQGPHFVVGTPGRIQDVAQKRVLNLDALKLFVLDEVDELMRRGFKGLIFDTMPMFPETLQMAVFGARLPEEELAAMKKWLQNPVRLLVPRKQLSLQGMRQFYVALDAEERKKDTLLELLELFDQKQVAVYTNTRRKSDFLSWHLTEKGVAHSQMHTELNQAEREELLGRFVPEAAGVLLSTDMLGNTEKHVFPIVINYDVPNNCENYLHRAGRVDSLYSRGVAISLATAADAPALRDISKYLAIEIEELPEDILNFISTDLD